MDQQLMGLLNAYLSRFGFGQLAQLLQGGLQGPQGAPPIPSVGGGGFFPPKDIPRPPKVSPPWPGAPGGPPTPADAVAPIGQVDIPGAARGGRGGPRGRPTTPPLPPSPGGDVVQPPPDMTPPGGRRPHPLSWVPEWQDYQEWGYQVDPNTPFEALPPRIQAMINQRGGPNPIQTQPLGMGSFPGPGPLGGASGPYFPPKDPRVGPKVPPAWPEQPPTPPLPAQPIPPVGIPPSTGPMSRRGPRIPQIPQVPSPSETLGGGGGITGSLGRRSRTGLLG